MVQICLMSQTILLFIVDAPTTEMIGDLGKAAEKLNNSSLRVCEVFMYLYSLVLLPYKREPFEGSYVIWK